VKVVVVDYNKYLSYCLHKSNAIFVDVPSTLPDVSFRGIKLPSCIVVPWVSSQIKYGYPISNIGKKVGRI